MRQSGKVVVESPRIVERRRAVRAERRRRRMRAGLGAVLVASVVGGGWGLTKTPVFALDRIEVTGVNGAERAAVLAAAGVRVGQPAIGIDLEQVAARVEALPAVASARVTKAGSLALRIQVKPRVAALIVRAGEQDVLLDREGRQVQRAPKRRLPVLEGRSLEEAMSASPTVLTLWRRADPEVRRSIDAFRITREGVVATMGETSVVFGDATRAAPKMRALRLVLRRLEADELRARRVDLRAPGRPAIVLG